MSGSVPIVRPRADDEARDLSLGEIVSLRLTADDVEELNRFVQREQRLASQIIRAALRAYFQTHRPGA